MRREDRPITRRAIISRAGVHRNFLYRHKDLADQIDNAAADYRSRPPRRQADRISHDSLLTELAAARQRNRELQQRIQILEHRLGAQGSTLGPELLERHPLVVELRQHLTQAGIQNQENDRLIESLREDIEILRETNRSLVREYGLA
ncbi:Uncharacterised protein [Mycobacteroides abscessus subsp. abscessus]|nr:Uncharacterised protein [Mycobacteroides abscessus subsp. abscessus]SHY32103.1 Uncharacterised protein [Mycobacteroides abscessus subsp. abscessus]SIB14806.1 Uncharacterised protein [Mycobacteroides abscessus subsp. abscessus]SIC38468.1 Uncharacterised protein [Mycobacteroides abscessus subsp. abscessus]SIC78892.1 Uncharacterised protein [Mycobacteroides abscessus subsp. abscessus]